MSTTELIEWMAFFRIEQNDQRLERERAEDAAAARQVVRGMSGGSFR